MSTLFVAVVFYCTSSFCSFYADTDKMHASEALCSTALQQVAQAVTAAAGPVKMWGTCIPMSVGII